MNRIIKFRGKRIDNGEWVYGSPYFLKIKEKEPEDCVNVACIITWIDWDGSVGFMSPDNNSFVEVAPESICQFTGLHDKNGKEIYDGDVISCKSYNFQRLSNMKYKIVYFPIDMAFKLVSVDDGSEHGRNGFTDFEIIGNIHEPLN